MVKSAFEAISLLTPYDVDKPKARIGPNADGGYVLLDDLRSDQPVVSYGISTEYSFERALAERGHKVFMFDHTISGISQPHPNMRFFREGVAGETQHEQSLFTIEEHLSRHGIESDRTILKMDVEGAEFGALVATGSSTLSRFEQMIIEVHFLNRLGDEGYRTSFVHLFERINSLFTLFHIHGNNFDGPEKFHFVDGIPVTEMIELSYVRTSSVKRQPSRTVYPTKLDFPNVRQRDKLMWLYPFLPSDPTQEAFAASFEHVSSTAPAPIG
jgi:Methyltransferase FkbM domain